MYPDEYSYTREHEWVKIEGDDCTVGITDFAQQELGEVVFVELPEIGDAFAANDEIGTIESVKAVAEVYTPVAGEVIAVNEALVDSPELLNEHPHDKAWLVKIKMSAPPDEGALMSSEAYEKFAAGEGA